MSGIAILGGSGMDSLDGLEITRREHVSTPYGEPSDTLNHGTLNGAAVIFLARHGAAHTLPPHCINYRANLWALRQLGVSRVLAVCAVGGINPAIQPTALITPDQLVDYTWGRAHTLYDGEDNTVEHIDFTEPYCSELRAQLITAAGQAGLTITATATYAATQGPRLETAAEIRRLQNDGCDIVGMTGMPEASIARELGLCYATLAVSANNAAGRDPGPIEMPAVMRNLETGMQQARLLINKVLPLLQR